MKGRVYGVDALRGLLACGVMLYHFLSWSNATLYYTYKVFFEALSIYIVETFFIISGFSLFYVYHNKGGISTYRDLKVFFLRRFYRIAPLFYTLLTAVVLIKLASPWLGITINRPLDAYLLGVNFTFLYGITNPADSLVVAGWSIGVEMTMYLLFPLMLLYVKDKMTSIKLLVLMLLAEALYQSVFLDQTIEFYKQWKEHTYFINHLSFFSSGFLVYFIFKDLKIPSVLPLLLIPLLLILFGFSTIEEYTIGIGRYLWLVLCTGVVILFSLIDVKNKLLIHLGDLIYSIYLCHFFVYQIISRIFESTIYIVLVSVVGTYILASILYKYIEIPMIRYGRRYG